MATKIRSEISKRNQYYISKHRYYELKHYCMQYKEWKRAYEDLCTDIHSKSIIIVQNDDVRSVHADISDVRDYYYKNIELVEDAAALTDSYFGKYILKAVTEGLTYNYFRMNYDIPCCKDYYYELYRKFFWILSQRKK